MRVFRIMSAIVGALACVASPAAAGDRITVFAAASMSEALTEVGASFEQETGTEIVFSFAGTGTLARQIEAGAPADVFVSADEEWMAYLTSRGAVDAQTVTIIAGNSLVLVGPADAKSLELTSEAIAARVGNGRLAIADPDTVPAGRYGKAALTAIGLWDAVEGRLAPMDNVRVALASVARGDTPLGVVYGSDATVERQVKVVAEFPVSSHPDIHYPAGLVSGTASLGANFLAFLTGDVAQAIFADYGFATRP
ncbi:molybdate ABC transporter substrate-binding protein [Roseibium sp.]|uniref:molybdate ABC transporter substrate-binding protein n=1 Tax=Roseibium sp. TaxID=1936156 RepID=UPI003A97BF44